MEKTSERLQQIMREQNLKQADIIERAKPFMEEYGAKLTRPDISQYYHGKVKPTQEKLFLLAAALNVNEAWLMGYDVPRNRIKEVTELAQTQPMRSFLQNESELGEAYIETVVNEYFHITNEEYELVVAYRKADQGRQDSVRCLLGISTKEKNADVI